MKHKIKEWLKRYLVAEITGMILGLILGLISYFFTKNLIITAFVSTWAENIGYYGYIATIDILHSRKLHEKSKKNYGFISFLKNIRNLFLEFGFAEMFDSFLIRPFCLFIFPYVLGNVTLGLFIGMVVANIFFYIPTVIAYELRKKHLD